MIHEVLLALLGHTGGLICESEEGFVLSAAADGFLSEAERRLLEETVAIGFHCKCLSEWAAFVRERHFGALADLDWSALSGTPRTVLGHYAYAVAQRVEAALDDYRDRVVELEGQLLQEPSLPLAHMAAFLEEDRRVLCVLRRLVERAEEERLGGGPLLDLLQSAAASHMGDSGVFRCLWSVAAGAGSVLANQLVGWMVYGRLVDPDGDFFIGRAWHHHPPWRPGSALHGGPVDDFSKDIGGAAAQREWLSLFYLRPEAVPNTVLSLDTARRVLFAGRASRVLLRGGRWSAAPAGGGPDLAAIQDDVDALLGCFGAMSPPCVAERAVERIRARVSEKLRRLVVEEAGLAQHLAALKGFCLLGHGAFYQTLLEAARPLLRRPPPPHAEAELAQGPWATAVAELETALPAGPLGAGASARGSAPSAAPSTPRQGAARPLAGLFEPRFVPRHFDIQSFADAAPQLRLAGAARVVGSRAELGAAGGPAPGPPGAALPGMIWLAVRQRVELGFSHAFGLQVHAPPTGTAAAQSEHGCRVALCLQHRWGPDELCGWRHVADAQACEAAAADAGASQHPVWTALGECLALEVTLRVAPGRGGSSEADVHMALYLCQPGLGDGRRPPREAAADGPGMPVLELASESFTVPSPRGMIHSVRLGYDGAGHTLEASFGVDSDGPAFAVELDLGAAISLDLGCAYVGLCQLPLGHRHRVVAGPSAGTPVAQAPRREALDQPVSIVSWRHSMDALRTAADAASAPAQGGARRRAQDNKELVMRDAWFSAMELSYDAPWPLPLVITQASMERYNRLFKLLLAFRHVQLELLRASLPRGELLPWAMRSELSFFVSQVLVYFQQDVIEASFAKLMHSVEASREFGEVLEAHEGFLATLSAQCFLTAQEIHDALMTALQIAALFCWRMGEDARGEPPGGRHARAAERALELRQLQLEFEETVRAVLDMMVVMHQQGAHAHLSQLLLRLDYNGYFSGQAGDLAE